MLLRYSISAEAWAARQLRVISFLRFGAMGK
jgi:hypothetical protein